jgi:hypothetical protein
VEPKTDMEPETDKKIVPTTSDKIIPISITPHADAFEKRRATLEDKWIKEHEREIKQYIESKSTKSENTKMTKANE